MDKQAKPGKLPKSNALVEIEEHWIQKYLNKTTGNCNCNFICFP